MTLVDHNILALQQQVEVLKRSLSEEKQKSKQYIDQLQRIGQGWSATWEMDFLNKSLTWSDEMYDILQIEASAEPNMKILSDKLSPEGLHKLNGAISRIFVSGEEYSFEHTLISGEDILNFRSDLKPILNNQNQPVKLIGKLTDITSVKSAQKELEKLGIIAAQTSNAVATLTINTEIDWVNRAFTIMTGYRPDEANGKLFDSLFSEISEKKSNELFREAFKTSFSFITETQIKTKSGSKLWVVINASPVLDYLLNPESYIVIITDITDRKIAEQQLALKNKEITDSIRYAKRIQDAMLPSVDLFKEYFKDSFVIYLPKDIVSGDFYWASKLNNGNFALATADSTGHGVPGAIMSLLNITSLEKAIETYTEPSDILNATRKTIIERLKKDGSAEGGKDGMDASLTVYDFKNKKLIIAAANNPVWIIRGTETIEIKPDKMPVGKHDKDSVSFTQQEIDLQTGDVVYTLTDGFPDQFGGEKGKKFMSKNLRELLSSNAHLPMHEQKQLLEKTFTNWVGNLEQVDDVTLIGVRV